MPALTREKKITFREMRASGVRGLLIYCSGLQVQPLDDDQRRQMGPDDVRGRSWHDVLDVDPVSEFDESHF
jgi:hypothetical protein